MVEEDGPNGHTQSKPDLVQILLTQKSILYAILI
jgi:hypothetical protein